MVSHLEQDDFDAAGAEEPFSEGIIDSLRAVEGAEIAALIREPPTQNGPLRRVSLRTTEQGLDVSAIARKSGGGGHKQAAGFPSEAASRRSRSSSGASSSRRPTGLGGRAPAWGRPRATHRVEPIRENRARGSRIVSEGAR